MAKHILENEIKKNIEDDDIGNSIDDFEIITNLGKGGYGDVEKVRSKKNQKIYALKKIDLEKIKNEEEKNLIMDEIKIMKSLNSPYITKYYNHFEINNNKICILMEYINNGDLCKYCQAYKDMGKAIDEKEIWEFLYQSISGLYYIHQNDIIHRDLKDSNFFLTEDKKIKIGDFGISAKRKINVENKLEKETIYIGTPLFISPEMIDRKPYGSKTDIYSLGCIFHELCFFKLPREPFKDENNKIILRDISIKFNEDKYSEELIIIIKKMLEKDPSKRPNTVQLFKEIKDVYNSRRIQCSSIFSVFRAFISFKIIWDKIPALIPTEKQNSEKMPITCLLYLVLKNMSKPENTR